MNQYEFIFHSSSPPFFFSFARFQPEKPQESVVSDMEMLSSSIYALILLIKKYWTSSEDLQ